MHYAALLVFISRHRLLFMYRTAEQSGQCSALNEVSRSCLEARKVTLILYLKQCKIVLQLGMKKSVDNPCNRVVCQVVCAVNLSQFLCAKFQRHIFTMEVRGKPHWQVSSKYEMKIPLTMINSAGKGRGVAISSSRTVD